MPRAVVELAHLGRLHRRHPLDRVLEQRLEPRPVLGQELGLEAVGHAVERPRSGVALVAAHDQAADLGAEVDQPVGVAQRGQRLQRRVERLGDQELVPVGDDRHLGADHPPDLRRVHAAGVHDDVGANRALVGDHLVHAAVAKVDAGDAGALLDVGPEPAGAVGERKGELAGIEVPVERDEGGRDDAVGGHRREHRLGLGGRDELHLEAKALRPAGLALNLLVALAR